MIYFDNSATTMQKPPGVAQAVMQAIGTYGNAGRSFCDPAIEATRAVFRARKEVATLVKLENPLQVAFTSGSTESLNLVLNSLLTAEDHVITTVLEHNSVLRPLYKIGCEISYINCDDAGYLQLDSLSELLKQQTKCIICTHGSNVLGTITNVKQLFRFCKENGLLLILDVSQTMGAIETYADMGDILCFTGHKALFGPQGTGGIIVGEQNSMKQPFKLVKTGGSGEHSFAPHQSLTMPDIFEAGTVNAHGLAGLQQGIAYVNHRGIADVARQEAVLFDHLLQGVKEIRGIELYGATPDRDREHLPVIALNIKGLPAEEVSYQLWDRWQIATRPGSHCAPLLHERFGTKERGMVRISLTIFNTLQEVQTAVEALWMIASGKG
ncbi:MAG: aminotransferase class V-fold PLP-dependent enzyme [Lachnospiraceae bacterium]